MSDALSKAISHSRARITSFHHEFSSLKAAGKVDLGIGTDPSSLSSIFGSNRQGNERYVMFRGWVYAAINALAQEAAGQPVNVGRLEGASPIEEDDERRMRQHRIKANHYIRTKMADQQWEIIYDHPMTQILESPNEIQNRWQFVYSFVANLCLTGWAYIVGGIGPDGKPVFYSLPTTWVTPIHKNGPFSEFKIGDPDRHVQETDKVLLTRENVSFAHLPNPANLLGALAPAGAQISAIRIDDHIQTSQEKFFENGVFPSVVVTVGKDPHPDYNPSGGIRPRLSGEQRRQVVGAIRKVMTGVANYGNPAIVDGLIEKIERLSATSNEMGWDKSEDKIRTRILSAFGVHPFILGEPVNVGGYAQAAIIHDRFCKRVNTYLDMLGTIMSNFAAPFSDANGKLFVWWEPSEPSDPSLRSVNLREARKNRDITKNEMRAELGFPPDEKDEGEEDTRSALLDDVNGITGYIQIASLVGQGLLSPDAGANALVTFFQIDMETAQAMLNDEEFSLSLNEPSPLPPPPPIDEDLDSSTINGEDLVDDSFQEAVTALNTAVKVLQMTPQGVASLIDTASKKR